MHATLSERRSPLLTQVCGVCAVCVECSLRALCVDTRVSSVCGWGLHVMPSSIFALIISLHAIPLAVTVLCRNYNPWNDPLKSSLATQAFLHTLYTGGGLTHVMQCHVKYNFCWHSTLNSIESEKSVLAMRSMDLVGNHLILAPTSRKGLKLHRTATEKRFMGCHI
jgi:hypothetical protein